MQPFLNFLIDIKDAKFGFDVIGKAIADMYNAIVANPTIQMIWNARSNFRMEHTTFWMIPPHQCFCTNDMF